MNNILENIKSIRQSLGFGQEYMAEKLNMTQAGYALWEKGARELTYNNLNRIAEIFSMSVIDVIAYPKHYVDSSTFSNPKDDKVSVIFEVSRSQRDYLLRLVMGDDKKIINVNGD